MTEAAWRGVGEQVAGELDALAAKDGLLDPGKHGSFQRYGGSMPTGHRARIQAAVRERYLADGDSLVVREHRAAIVTAGPPGAGKSTAIKSMGRWWEGRQAAITGVDPLGGRYINITKNLDAYWNPDGTSICAENARHAVLLAQQYGLVVDSVGLVDS